MGEPALLQPGAGEASEPRKARYEALIAAHQDVLYRTALTLTRRRDDAEDLLQETLIRAWRSLDSLIEGKSPRGWLIAILVNAHRSRYRKSRRGPETVSLEADDTYLRKGAVEGAALGGANPEETVLADELSDPVRTAILGLPTAFREPLLLVDLEGFSYAEAAEILGLLSGTVMSRLHRARRRLRKALAPYVSAESDRRAPERRKAGPEQARLRRRGISCGEACRHLHAYIDGILSEQDATRVEEHLDTCRRCCDRFEFARRQKALLTIHHLGTTIPRGLVLRLQGLMMQFSQH